MGQKSKYDPYTDWILEHYKEYRDCSELAKALNDNFGIDAKPRGIPDWFDRRFGIKPVYGRHEFSDEEKEFIKKYYPDHGPEKTVEMLKEVFGTNRTLSSVKTMANSKLGLKVRGAFKEEIERKRLEGLRAKISREIGTLRPDNVNKKGHTNYKIKIGPNKWKAAGVVIWEQTYGPIPKGYRIIYLDGDNSNLSVDNLYLATHKIAYAVTTNKCYQSKNSEITKALIKYYELRTALGINCIQWYNIQRKFERKYGKEFVDATL